MAKKAAKKLEKSLAETLRQEIADGEYSRYRIAQLTGVTEATLSRFMSGASSLSVDNAGKICELLKLHLVKKPEESEEKE